jgi:hypothetical protein
MSSERRIDPATGREPDDPRHSNDELAGDMGVSSEREGPTGPGQHGTDGVRYTGPTDTPGDAPPEQSAGGEETNPDGVAPKAGYPSTDPRSGEKPYEPGH